MPVTAIKHVRSMRGGTQSHLMLASDSNFYVVKFLNNPQHSRILTNELIAGGLLQMLGLPAPVGEIVDVGRGLIAGSEELRIETGLGLEPCSAGPQFGSRFVGSLIPGLAADYLPSGELARVMNLTDFFGMLAFDKWTSNADGRQVVFRRNRMGWRFHAIFIDHGLCFNGGDWRFTDAPLSGAYARNMVYESVKGWESFEPWLTRIEEFNPGRLERLAYLVPEEWVGDSRGALEALLEKLVRRRSRVRELIQSFRVSSRSPFPHWTSVSNAVVAA